MDIVTGMRNEIVHPPDTNGNANPQVVAKRNRELSDAYKLALGLLKLVILGIIDYRGPYRSRFETGYPGTVLTVPWA
jgi:hypothetical protein